MPTWLCASSLSGNLVRGLQSLVEHLKHRRLMHARHAQCSHKSLLGICEHSAPVPDLALFCLKSAHTRTKRYRVMRVERPFKGHLADSVPGSTGDHRWLTPAALQAVHHSIAASNTKSLRARNAIMFYLLDRQTPREHNNLGSSAATSAQGECRLC